VVSPTPNFHPVAQGSLIALPPEPTPADARQLSKLLPFRQVLGIKNVVNAMVVRFAVE